MWIPLLRLFMASFCFLVLSVESCLPIKMSVMNYLSENLAILFRNVTGRGLIFCIWIRRQFHHERHLDGRSCQFDGFNQFHRIVIHKGNNPGTGSDEFSGHLEGGLRIGALQAQPGDELKHIFPRDSDSASGPVYHPFFRFWSGRLSLLSRPFHTYGIRYKDFYQLVIFPVFPNVPGCGLSGYHSLSSLYIHKYRSSI